MNNKSDDVNNYAAALNIDKREWPLVLKSALIGAVSGGVVTCYRYVLTRAEDFSLSMYDFLRLYPARLPFWIAAVLAMALFAGWLSSRCEMIGGSGIPQVKGIILGYFKDTWFSTLIAKFVGGVAAITAGLSLGREGPSIQLGACVAEGTGNLLAKSRTERKILIAGGASAGLAAAFNAPLAGVVFAFEEIFRYLSPPILLSTTVAAVVADYISKLFVGTRSVFSFPVAEALPLSSYWILILMGVMTGLAGAFYNMVLVWAQRSYGRLWQSPKSKILKPIPIFLLAVAVGLAFPAALCGGHAILGQLDMNKGVAFFAALLAIKFLFSVVSFSSGAPGGIFFPLLILGAILGGIFWKITDMLSVCGGEFFSNFIILAMAGLFTSIVRAPITGIVLLIEMTGSFSYLLSLTIVSITSYVVANTTKVPPIYDSLLDNMTAGRGTASGESNKRVMIDIAVHHGAEFEGAYIRELQLPSQCLIVALRRGDKNFTPHGDTRIMANDFLTVMCDAEAEAEIHELLKEFFEDPLS
ncbi:MAG: ClC family H(+)/Cl(-) exchange transporter [Synergistaceae bacterium]|nr:ClC family H(+)/Cl(-) exchange transporter [Synergistaceae bacterium]